MSGKQSRKEETSMDTEISSAPVTPGGHERLVLTPPVISCPPSQLHSPSLSRSPLLHTDSSITETAAAPSKSTPRTPIRISLTPRFITPLGTPIRKALRLTKLNPQDAWLPITESRNGNAYYAAFHTLCSGIGIQALVLPVAFTVLGWTWGIISLFFTFTWQLYTLWLLVQLHESTENEIRYSRYLQLCCAAFGDRLGKLLGLLPLVNLSGGTCTALVIIGGSTSKQFYEIICGTTCTAKPLTTVEWYLIFTSAAVLLSQLPNLNSIAGVSLIGAITALGYCTLIWVISIVKGRLPGVSYDPVSAKSENTRVFAVFNALGVIAFAFRGHNLILEIQATMPSSEKHPSHFPMWRGVKFAYILVAMCLFPLAIGGYWAYGDKIPAEQGMLTALYQFHSRDVSRFVLGLASLSVIINSLSSFQIYGMPVFDDTESVYVSRKKKPCPWWLRSLIRVFLGYSFFFTAVAVPFLGSLAGLIGGTALPVTLAYPCFMWLKIKKPNMYSGMWLLNWGLGVLGISLSCVIVAAGVYVVVTTGIELSFFNPH